MKQKHLFAFLSTLLFATFTIAAVAQDTVGHWMWAQKYTGQDWQANSNEILNMETDPEGNIYYFGICGSSASFGNAGSGGYLAEGLPEQIINISSRNFWIAKYSRSGEQIWRKMVGMGRYYDALYPGWMELRNDTIYIVGGYIFEKAGGRWMWFYDTLITSNDISNSPDSQHRPPFVAGKWTFFTKMDLDGNVVSTFFANAQERGDGEGGYRPLTLLNYSMYFKSPLHVDCNGNFYLLSLRQYSGNEDYPFTVWVYSGDSTWHYDLYLPGSYQSGHSLNCYAVYKFSPEGRLIWQKQLFDHAENVLTVGDYYQALGHDWDVTADTMPFFTIYPYGFAADEDDNLYFSGEVATWTGVPAFDNQTQYPTRVFVDSTHWVEASCQMEAKFGVPFLFKMDTTGTIQYLCQPRKNSNLDVSRMAITTSFRGITISDSSIYVIGNIVSHAVDDVIEFAPGVFFDRVSYPNQTEFPLFVRYDKETGAFRNYGTSHVKGLVTSGVEAGTYRDMNISTYRYEQHFVLGNRLFAMLSHISAPSLCTYYIGQWCTDGTFIDTVRLYNDTRVRQHLLQPQPNGDLLGAFQTFGDFYLDDYHFTGFSSSSSAIFGVYHNDVFAHPFVGTGIPQYSLNRIGGVRVFPNPGVDYVTVILQNPDERIRTIEMFDINGRRVLTSSQSIINVKALSAGTYLLRITTDRGTSHAKFVKQR